MCSSDLQSLARIYARQGRYPEADNLLGRLLAIQEQSLGPDDPGLAATLEDYARVLKQMNREAQAAEVETRAKAIRSKRKSD